MSRAGFVDMIMIFIHTKFYVLSSISSLYKFCSVTEFLIYFLEKSMGSVKVGYCVFERLPHKIPGLYYIK